MLRKGRKEGRRERDRERLRDREREEQEITLLRSPCHLWGHHAVIVLLVCLFLLFKANTYPTPTSKLQDFLAQCLPDSELWCRLPASLAHPAML